MNQEDRAAVPMTGAFTAKPDYTPFTALPSNVPLNLGVDPTQAGFAGPALAKAWQAWGAKQHFGGHAPIADYANNAQLNRYDWYSATGWTPPYPGDAWLLAPADVPGANAPRGLLEDG